MASQPLLFYRPWLASVNSNVFMKLGWWNGLTGPFLCENGFCPLQIPIVIVVGESDLTDEKQDGNVWIAIFVHSISRSPTPLKWGSAFCEVLPCPNLSYNHWASSSEHLSDSQYFTNRRSMLVQYVWSSRLWICNNDQFWSYKFRQPQTKNCISRGGLKIWTTLWERSTSHRMWAHSALWSFDS